MDVGTLNLAAMLRDGGDASTGGMGFFLVLVIIGIGVFLLLRGRQDRAEALGVAKRGMGSGPVPGHLFVSPFGKCPACGAAGGQMKQAWDGLRRVTWTCTYCGSVAGVQELKDEELPPGARQRLGLEQPLPMPGGQPGLTPPQGDGAVGGLLTGMMLGSMLGGERGERRDEWGGGGDPGAGGDWGSGPDAGGSDDGGWNDAGGGDS